MFTAKKRKNTERTTGIVGAGTAIVAIISGIRTLKTYIKGRKKRK